MGKSKIQWTDETDNLIVPKDSGWFCIKVSEGCQNCYAESLNKAGLYGGNGLAYQAKNLPELKLKREILEGWLRKTKPKRRFINSMTDTFGEFVKPKWVYEILDAAYVAENQTFQFLTKRADICRLAVDYWMDSRGMDQAPPNFWLGFSAENQARFDERWPYFEELNRAYGFTVWASLEPLIGGVELPESFLKLGNKAWAVAGGESGKKARPMHPDWARDLRGQCVEAGIPYFLKQWGEWIPGSQLKDLPEDIKDQVQAKKGILEWMHKSGNFDFEYFPPGGYIPNAWAGGWDLMNKLGKKAAGRLLDGREWNEFPDARS